MENSQIKIALTTLSAHRADRPVNTRNEFSSDPGRFSALHIVFKDMLFDFSKQRIGPANVGAPGGAGASRGH